MIPVTLSLEGLWTFLSITGISVPGCLERQSIGIIGTDKKGRKMKKDTHPEYLQSTIRCHCGYEFQAGSTKENISVEICSQCHPFYTGKQKLVDSAGRIERFRRKYSKFLKEEKQEKKAEANEE